MNGSDKWRDKAKEFRAYARYFADNGMPGAARDSRRDAEYCQKKAYREERRAERPKEHLTLVAGWR